MALLGENVSQKMIGTEMIRPLRNFNHETVQKCPYAMHPKLSEMISAFGYVAVMKDEGNPDESGQIDVF